MEQKQKKKVNLVVVSAKIPIEMRTLIEQKAEKEERSISQVVSRLLVSHPDLQSKEIALPA